MREHHGHDSYPRVGHPGGHGQQDRTAAAGGSETGGGERHRAGGQARGGQPGMPGHARDTRVIAGGQGQRDERGDAGDDGQDGSPGGPAQPVARPQPDRSHAEQQGRGDQHLHDRQRAGAQRDRVDGESAEFHADAEQPPWAPHQQQEQPGPTRRLTGRRGGLALLQRGTGSVEDSSGQRPHEGHHRNTPGQPAGDAAPGGATAAEGRFVLSLVAKSDTRSTVSTRYIASHQGFPRYHPGITPRIASACATHLTPSGCSIRLCRCSSHATRQPAAAAAALLILSAWNAHDHLVGSPEGAAGSPPTLRRSAVLLALTTYGELDLLLPRQSAPLEQSYVSTGDRRLHIDRPSGRRCR